MFFGTYTVNMDDNHRISLPASFKKTLETDLFITKSIEQDEKFTRLWLFNKTEFEAKADEISNLSFLQQDHRDVQTIFLGTTYEITLDPKGRISLPKEAYAMGKFGKEIVLIGAGKRIEIWDKEVYENFMKAKTPTFASEVERISL